MRIWDLEPRYLCQKHLVAEHRELHGFWNILVKHGGKGGYSKHPETLRWVGKENALYLRHEALVCEFQRRGYRHHTTLDPKFAVGIAVQNEFLNTIIEQKEILKNKGCLCASNF